MKGLKKVAGESKSLRGFYSPEYLQLNYDRKECRVWADYFYCVGHNSFTKYDDPDIINCGIITKPMTQKEIVQMILDKLTEVA